MIDISIVIVNYNVKDFLYQCLLSIDKAKQNLSLEVFVVDNNSNDNSIAELSPLFTEYHYFIQNHINVGFAKANNIAIQRATGKYLLILNPDTLLSEDTLVTMFNFMENNSDVGIAGCKVLNSDGSFQFQCRRGFPTPWVAFCKLFGLQKIFPNSKYFTQYNQLFRPINEISNIDAVIGAFMFCDTILIQNIGGFDERYFMYGEDIDLCRQVQLKKRNVVYYPKTTIIHFKGESTKRSGLDEIKQQYNAMEFFARKYFTVYGRLFILFLKLGITIRSLLARINKNKILLLFIISDIIFINVSMLIGTQIRFGGFFKLPEYSYIPIILALSLTYFFTQTLNGEYFEKHVSIPNTFLSLMFSFFILSSLTYFFPEYRFSRGVLLATIGLTTFLSTGLRLIYVLYDKLTGKNANRNIIIAGSEENVVKMLIHFQENIQPNINIIGTVGYNSHKNEYPYLGDFDAINSIATKNKANEIIITAPEVSAKDIVKIIAHSQQKIKYHIIPEYDEFAVSQVINELSVTTTNNLYRIATFRSRFIKRFFDVLFSLILLTLMLPVSFIKSKIYKKIWNIFIGKLTFVGLRKIHNSDITLCNEGLISLADLNNTSQNTKVIDKLNNYYIQNYSFLLDIEILIKYILN